MGYLSSDLARSQPIVSFHDAFATERPELVVMDLRPGTPSIIDALVMPIFFARKTTRYALLFSIVAALGAHSAHAQPAAKTKKSTAPATPSILGGWVGKATVPLPDSTIIVPVLYNFVQTGGSIGGTALVPGQGSGPISNVVLNGTHVQFRVTAPEGKLLEHDGTFNADGTIEGMVNLDNAPIAKFKIAPKPPASPPAR